MKKILLGIIILLNQQTMAQNNFPEKLYHAYLKGDMTSWLHDMQTRDQIANQLTGQDFLDLALAKYGYIGYCLGKDDTKNAKKWVTSLEKQLNSAEKQGLSQENLFSLQGALQGFYIGLSPYKAVYYGPKSMANVEKALSINNNAALPTLEMGNIQYYMPSMFGGSKAEAAKYYSRAIILMENQNMHKQNWLYMSTLASLSQAYEKSGNTAEAEKTYLKILRLEPDFKWVKEELYPHFQENMQP